MGGNFMGRLEPGYRRQAHQDRHPAVGHQQSIYHSIHPDLEFMMRMRPSFFHHLHPPTISARAESHFHRRLLAATQFNYLIEMILLGLILLLNFTGYILRWDEGIRWALVAGTNLVKAIPVVGSSLYRLLSVEHNLVQQP